MNLNGALRHHTQYLTKGVLLILRGRLHSRFPSHLTHFALHQTLLAAKEAQAIAPAQSDWNAA